LLPINMVTYIRTHEGQLAAYSQSSAIPRKLRSLLKLIDGKTTLAVYTDSLQAFGDVPGILTSLSMAGLIRAKEHQVPVSEDPVKNSSQDGVNTHAWGSLSSMGSAFSPSVPSEAGTQATYNNTRTDPAVNSQARAQALATVVERMSDFVLINAPEHAFLVLKELESLSSLEQLAVTLGGYEQLVSHLGELSHQHLTHIRQLLREHI
jgi:hypothetical protein